jgi:hypothetical protein
MKWHVALGLALIVCGTVMSTAAVPLSGQVDELAPAEDTGVTLAPADTSNGDRYASFDSNGELVVSVDVFSDTKTVFDDVFVVGFGGVTGSDEAATIRIEHDSEWLDIYENSETGARESVDEGSNTLTLDPGEQATLGFAVTTAAGSPSSLSETVTYTMEIPDAESSTGEGGGGGSSVGGGSGGDGGDTNAGDGDGTDAGSGGGDDTTASNGNGTDSPETATPADEPTGSPADSDGGTEAVADAGDEPVPSTPGSQQSAEPSGFAFNFAPAFGVGWGPWSIIAGLLAVVTNYLVQTRYHEVLPVLQTQPNDRRHRFRRIAVREAGIGLTGLVLAVLAVSAAASAGFGPVSQLVTALTVSAAVGMVTGYRLLPELDVLSESTAADSGTERE